MSKINILAIPPDGHGVGKFRIISPYTHLQENYGDDFHVDIKTKINKEDNPFEKYDIIIAHSFIFKDGDIDKNGKHKPSSINSEVKTINDLKRQGKIVIIDIDDFWLPTQKHPMYHSIIKHNVHKKKIEFLKNASYVTTTTPTFQRTINKKLNLKNVFVFPNAIDVTEPQFKPNPIQSDKIRFGWLGGSSHLHDIKEIRQGLTYILDNFINKTQFVLCGFDTRGTVNEVNKETGEVNQRPIKPHETVWYEYEKMFTKNYTVLDEEYIKFLQEFKNEYYNNENKPYIRKWTEKISKYAENYNYFDVSLAPLLNNEFNNNKSQLKAIEAGIHKKAIIASYHEPYTIDLINAFDEKNNINPKGNALLIPEHKNHKLWGKYMKYLIKNPNMINDLAEKLNELIYRKYILDVVNKERSEFLKSIINK